jgi:MFS family permease
MVLAGGEGSHHQGGRLMDQTPMHRVAAASAIGTILEWYDFALYNAMAGLVFNKIFFPSFDPLVGTLLAFLTYGVGMVARPVGGIICGRLGDIIGRRPMLIATVSVMGGSTALIGLLPGYDKIGVLAPILLVVLRFVQGIMLGGEWAGAVLLSVEHGSASRRGLNASWTQCGTPGGTLLATAALATTTALTSNADFIAWAWRIPFLISLVIIVYAVWLRRRVDETPQFREIKAKDQTARAPVREVLRNHWARVLMGCGIKFGPDAVGALMFTFTLTYLTQIVRVDRSLALTAVSIGSAANLLTIPLFGALSDRWGRRSIYLVGVGLAIVWTSLLFKLLDTAIPSVVILAVVIGLVIHASLWGTQASFITEQFPTRLRYTGSSLSYTLAGVVAAATPAALVALQSQFQASWAPAAYVIFLLLVTGVVVLGSTSRPIDEFEKES